MVSHIGRFFLFILLLLLAVFSFPLTNGAEIALVLLRGHAVVAGREAAAGGVRVLGLLPVIVHDQSREVKLGVAVGGLKAAREPPAAVTAHSAAPLDTNLNFLPFFPMVTQKMLLNILF